eukprot:s3_g59.t1
MSRFDGWWISPRQRQLPLAAHRCRRQRLSVADVSLACSLCSAVEKAGHEKIRQSHPSALRWLLTSLHHIDRAMASQAQPAPKASAKAAEPKTAKAPEPEAQKAAAKAAPKEADEAAGAEGWELHFL